MSSKKALYAGIFFDDGSVDNLVKEEKHHLTRLIKDMHVTYKFNPDDRYLKGFTSLVGMLVPVLVYGYGSSKDNSGFLVDIPSQGKMFYENESKPHVTVSVSDNGKPKDTGSLTFDDLDNYFIVYGRFGICYNTGVVSIKEYE